MQARSGSLSLPTPLRYAIRSRWFPFSIVFVSLGMYALGYVLRSHLVTLVIRLMPEEADKGFAFYDDFVMLCLNEVLWLGFFFTLAWVLYVTMRNRTIDILTSRWATPNLFWIVLPIVYAVTLAVAYFVLEGFPNSSDEYAYLFQAETLSNGKLWQPAPTVQEAFHFNHIAIKDGIRIGRFPPGWPLFLSISFFSGFPAWLLNPLLGILTLVVFFSFAKNHYGNKVATWSVVALGFCAFYIFNAASYFSHVSCLLFTVLFTWCISLIDKHKFSYALLAGLCLGIIFIIRYYTAALLFLPVAFYLIHNFQRRALPMFILMGIGSLPCFAILLWYNYQITGDPFTPVTIWAYASEGLGFINGHTYLKGAEHFLRRIFMFAYWCSPGLLILYFVFMKRKIWSATERWTSPQDYYFLLLLIGHFFYYQIGGNQYGPRFMLEGLPFLIVFVINSLVRSESKSMMAIFVASLLFAVVKFPSIASREATVVDERQDLYDIVAAQHLSHAIVVIGAPTGIVRPMPAGDLTRNDKNFNGSVLYVQDNPGALSNLRKIYKTYSVYRYTRNLNSKQGSLQKLE